MHLLLCIPLFFTIFQLPIVAEEEPTGMHLVVLIPDTTTLEDHVFRNIVGATKFISFVYRQNDDIAFIVFSNISRIHINFGTDLRSELFTSWNPMRHPGSRATHLALKDAGKAFADPRRQGKAVKVVNLFLDGISDDVQAAVEEARKLRESGIYIVVDISLNADSTLEAHARALAGPMPTQGRVDRNRIFTDLD